MPALSFELVADDVATGDVDGGVAVSEADEEAGLVFDDVSHVVDSMAALFGGLAVRQSADPLSSTTGVAWTKRARIRRYSKIGRSGYRRRAPLFRPGRNSGAEHRVYCCKSRIHDRPRGGSMLRNPRNACEARAE